MYKMLIFSNFVFSDFLDISRKKSFQLFMGIMLLAVFRCSITAQCTSTVNRKIYKVPLIILLYMEKVRMYICKTFIVVRKYAWRKSYIHLELYMREIIFEWDLKIFNQWLVGKNCYLCYLHFFYNTCGTPHHMRLWHVHLSRNIIKRNIFKALNHKLMES